MPRRRRIHAGTVLARPTVSAKRENPAPASDHVHDISAIREGSTTPKELKVAPEIRKKMVLITTNSAHFSAAVFMPGCAAAGLFCTGELRFPCRDLIDQSYEIAQDASRQSSVDRGRASAGNGCKTERGALLLGFAAQRISAARCHARGLPRRPGADGDELAAARDADQSAPASLRAAHLHRQRDDASRRRRAGDLMRCRGRYADSAQRRARRLSCRKRSRAERCPTFPVS